MGFAVFRHDELGRDIGDMVADTEGAIGLSLPDPSDSAFICLRFVDPYGDTIFNHLQAAVLLREWDTLEQAFTKLNACGIWSKVREMIVACADEPHTYVKFMGD